MSWRKLPRSARLLLIAVLYAAVLTGHVFAVHLYVTRFSEKVDSREIAVAVRDIPPHTVLTSDDIALRRIRYSDLVDGAYTSLESAVGKESAAFIGSNEQLTPGKVNEAIKREGEMIVEIPEDWLLSFPKSLRRLDEIRLHPVYQKKGEATEVPASYVPVPLESSELSGITVAYFKDASANEVGDEAGNGGDSADSRRLKASSVGARLEVALTEPQFDLLQSLAIQQYRFIVSYE
ncbi:SAF domain-containing protein [Gorillibacterium massiliense]|uniref:SAF domain-containing protein n=1 Tax=Gorillibacterium massiliense TaxID=1280390 RepID=UPI0004B155B1|nr:SAF domain-containing protein [Gorillibacterium massiliense]